MRENPNSSDKETMTLEDRIAEIEARELVAAWVRSFPAEHIHRIRMVRGWLGQMEDCWTLVFVGDAARDIAARFKLIDLAEALYDDGAHNIDACVILMDVCDYLHDRAKYQQARTA